MSQVLIAVGTTESATIAEDGWYLIKGTGYWDPVHVYVNGLQIYSAQKTGDNANYVTTQMLLPLSQGDVVKISATGSANAVVYKIS